MTPAEPKRPVSGYFLVFMAGVLWSTVGLGIRMIEDALVWQILLYRSISLTALLYFVIRIRTGLDPFLLVRRAGLPGVIGGLSLVAAYTGGIYAVQTTSVAQAMVLFASAPFMAAVLGLLILHEPVRRATWAAIVFAFLGIGIMVWGNTEGTAISGSLAALGSAFGFAVFTIALRWGKKGEMMPSVFLSGIFAIITMSAICILLDLPLTISPRDSGISLGMGVFQVGAGLILYTIGSKTVPAADLTLLSLAEVVLGPFWVWLALGETTTVNTLIGGAILLAAIAANALSGARRKPPVTIV